MKNKAKRVMLVYQAGIANVFAVKCFNLSPFGRKAKRLYQGDFHSAVAFVRGCGAAGSIVKTAHCNQAGEITEAHWSDDLESAPFFKQLVDVHMNE